MKDGYNVELSVKACAETEYSIDIKLPVSEAAQGSLVEGEDYSRIEMNDNGTPEDTSDDTPLNYVIDKVKLDSEYTSSVAYEHVVIGEIEITNAGDNYYRTEKEFFFFDSCYRSDCFGKNSTACYDKKGRSTRNASHYASYR